MSGQSSAFLELHLATFEHSFYPFYVENQWVHEIEVVWWLLTEYSCSGLPLYWCGVPKLLRAVCPVICGFMFDFHCVRSTASFPKAQTSGQEFWEG